MGDIKNLKKSKYSYVDKDKLDDLYYTNLLRELYAIPVNKLQEYINQFYKNPSVLELIEIREIINLTNRLSDDSAEPFSKEEYDMIKYKHSRMYGKIKDVVELSGRDGGPINFSDLSESEIDQHIKNRASAIVKAIKKAKKV